jgi:ribonuclease HI
MARIKDPRKMEMEVFIIKLIHKIHTIAVATGKYCNNYNAETVALIHAAKALREQLAYVRDKVVIFTDALSVVTALKSLTSTGLELTHWKA